MYVSRTGLPIIINCICSQIPALSDRCKQCRLSHLFKIVNNLTVFPEAPLQYRIINYNRFSQALQLQNIVARTSQFQNSFFPRTIAQCREHPALQHCLFTFRGYFTFCLCFQIKPIVISYLIFCSLVISRISCFC